MRNTLLRPWKSAGAVFFHCLLLGLVCLVALVACRAPCAAAFDVIDMFTPGDPTDVLAAGLALPGQFALYPDITQPTSLLNYPSSVTASAEQSRPWVEVSAAPTQLGAARLSSTVNYRGKARGATLAAAAHLGQSGLGFRESKTEQSNLDINQDDFGFGAAAGWAKTRLGVSLAGSSGTMSARSTRLSGIETVPGSGYGLITSDPSQKSDSAEITQDFGDYRVGLLASRSSGSLNFRTMANRQGYSALSEISGRRSAPYLIRSHGTTKDMLLLDASDQSLQGPVLIGRILAGSWHGDWVSSSIAVARLTDCRRGRKLSSLQYSDLNASLYGRAGGFVFPGLFSSSYTTDNNIGLRQITARYGFERTRGRTAIRWSVMLAHCDPTADTRTTEARWLRPLRVIADDSLQHTSVWLLSPAVGAGYSKGGLRVDAGLSVFAGIALGQKSAPKDPNAPKTAKTVSLPGYRWGISIRREF